MNIDDSFEKMKSDTKAQSAKRAKLEPVSIAKLFSMEFKENKWVVERLIPHEGITIISGAPASYKTWLLLQMAIDISEGNSFLNQFQCEKNKVLIIDEENHLRLIRDRLKLLGADENLPIYFLSQTGFLVSDQGLVDRVLEICQEKEIDVIFIDSLVRINNAEENDASQMSEVFKCIRQLCQNGKTVVITHHEKKEGVIKISAQNRLRGSSDILASVDAHIAVKKDNQDKSKILVEQAKLRSAKEVDPFEVKVNENDEKIRFDYLGACAEKISKKELAKDAVDFVLQEEQNGLSIKEICRKVNETENIGDKNIRYAIKELIADGVILEKKGGKNTKICVHSKFNQDALMTQGVII